MLLLEACIKNCRKAEVSFKGLSVERAAELEIVEANGGPVIKIFFKKSFFGVSIEDDTARALAAF